MLILLRFGAVLGLLLLTLLACGQGDTPLRPPEEALSLPVAVVAAPTAAPTAIPTPTLFPTATPQPVIRPPAMAIPAPTIAPTATPPPTPLPTVSPTATPPPVIPTPATPHPTIAPAAIPAPIIAPTATPPPTIATAAPDVAACDPDAKAPVAIQGEAAEVAAGNNAFALDLYHALRQEKDGNLLYSPYSLSLTLAMAYAGAGGETAEQMADTLNFTLPQPDLPPAFNWLNTGMLSRLALAACDGNAPELNIANALWGKEGYQFHTEFQDTLAANYGAELRQLDFETYPREATAAINDWVEQETRGKISQIYPADHFARLIDPENVRLILTNAIYFKGQWQKGFEESQTEDADFHLPDGSQVSVPLMYQRNDFLYTEGADYQAIELPYQGGNGNLAMVIVLPAAGSFADFEEALDEAMLQSLLDPSYTEEVILKMPRFRLESDFELMDTLREMGMPNAFIPGVADFSGIADSAAQEGEAGDGIFTSSVAHKAYIEVNEKGTAAAAVTAWDGCEYYEVEISPGVFVTAESCVESEPPPPVEMTIDRPFIFFLRDKGAGVILFIGRVLDPRG